MPAPTTITSNSVFIVTSVHSYLIIFEPTAENEGAASQQPQDNRNVVQKNALLNVTNCNYYNLFFYCGRWANAYLPCLRLLSGEIKPNCKIYYLDFDVALR